MLALSYASENKVLNLDGVVYDQDGLEQLRVKVVAWAKANGYQEKKGCYVATSVYGSYDCPPVWVLRRYRDQSLAQSTPGRAFVKAYYAVSPTLVARFGNVAWLRHIVQACLDRLVAHLRRRGVSDKAYSD